MSDQARSVAALKKADYGDYTGNAFVNGRLVEAWADNSNSTGDNPDGATDFDVYTAVRQASAGIAGSDPDGTGAPDPPLVLDMGLTGTLHLSWSPSCQATDSDYAVYEGAIGNCTSHVPLVCSTSGATTARIVPGAGNTYYLIVPNNASVEGSYGRDSGLLERPPSATACFRRATMACPY